MLMSSMKDWALMHGKILNTNKRIMDEVILKIINKHIQVSTIKSQGRDSLDFHDIHISQLVSIIKESIDTGCEMCLEAQSFTA